MADGAMMLPAPNGEVRHQHAPTPAPLETDETDRVHTFKEPPLTGSDWLKCLWGFFYLSIQEAVEAWPPQTLKNMEGNK